MLSYDLKNTGPDNRGTAMRNLDKQTPDTIKKAVLTDVQNANRNLMHNHREGSPFPERRPFSDTVKFCGTKRPVPEFPSVLPFYQNSTLSNTAPKEHITYAHNKFEIEPERQKFSNSTVNHSELRHFNNMQQDIPRKQTQIRNNNLHYVPAATPNHMAPKMTVSYVPPSLPNCKPSSGVKVSERDCLKASLETPKFAHSKGADDRQWDERYIRLQNSLKRCDESDNSDLVQRLRQLSPADLNMYAIELERKAIQLAIEEGKEMQRMKALNIFGKSPTTDSLQTTELPKSMK